MDQLDDVDDVRAGRGGDVHYDGNLRERFSGAETIGADTGDVLAVDGTVPTGAFHRSGNETRGEAIVHQDGAFAAYEGAIGDGQTEDARAGGQEYSVIGGDGQAGGALEDGDRAGEVIDADQVVGAILIEIAGEEL